MALRLAVSLAQKKMLRGIGIALCCHFKGDGHDDVAVDFFNSLGVRMIEMTLIHRMASWYVAMNESNETMNENENIEELNNDETQKLKNENNQNNEIDEKDLEKRQIGEMCRTILNIARAVWLQQQESIKEVGFIKYCQKSISLENVLLWATTHF